MTRSGASLSTFLRLFVLCFILLLLTLLATRTDHIERFQASSRASRHPVQRALRLLKLGHGLTWSFPTGTSSLYGYPRPLDAHPIFDRLEWAHAKWQSKLDDRSDGLYEAIQIYSDKYSMDPPQGFETWWQMAQDNDYQFIDSHDLLFEKMAPFMAMPPQEVRRRTWEVGSKETFSLVHIKAGNVSVTQMTPSLQSKIGQNQKRAEGLARLLAPSAHLLPDMSFAVNELAYPRNIQPWRAPDSYGWSSDEDVKYPSALLDSDESAWHIYRQTCLPGSAARGERSWASEHKLNSEMDREPRIAPAKVPEFQRDMHAFSQADICNNPDLHSLHSQFSNDYRPVEGLWPVFSVYTQEGYGDITFPSNKYVDSNYTDKHHLSDHDDHHKSLWSKKSNHIYWRGGTNPGYNAPAHGQQDSPRRRFLEMSAPKVETQEWVDVIYPDDTDATAQLGRFNSTAMNEGMMDVALTCESEGECEAARHNNYRFASKDPIHAVRKHKMLLDLDGSAYSGRFLALLETGGAVLKSTVYQEFFSEWIQPWYHYIPLSNDFREIYSIHAFFLGTKGSGLDDLTKPESSPQARQREALL